MVTRILGLETAPRPADAADALALAICHALARRSDAARLDAASGGPARREGARADDRLTGGPVGHVGLDRVVVEVGGVGCSSTPRPARPPACRTAAGGAVATTLVVREDSLTLFGFGPTTSATCSRRCRPSPASVRASPWPCSRVIAPDELRAALASGDIRP